uniref:GAF domain-containing protein n=1 Tax=Desertifilum tharense IPPAS B-1220 TaxID=1781255 RepID=A0ACD5H1C3_9CYAN
MSTARSLCGEATQSNPLVRNCWYAYRRGHTATATDVTSDPNLSAAHRATYADVQIAAYIGVPLVKQGEFVAGLAVHSSTPRYWTADEIALTEEVVERTWYRC